jgi:NDP-sugar pyrophosphorylase family protein
MKKRISLTIDEKLLKQIDKFVDNINFESRSHLIEYCIIKYLENSYVAVILAGGNPKKLKIKGKFKFLIPIKGDKTLLDFLFEKLKNFGKVFIVGQREVINACFEKLGNKINNTEIEHVEERKELGNAKTLELVKNKLPNSFLILPIDQYYEFDFLDLIKKHNLNRAIYGSIVTLTVSPISTKEKLGSIAMIGSKIVKHEEGKKGKKNLISAFAAVCDKIIFNYIPKGEIKWVLQDNVYPKLTEQGKMSGYLLNTPVFNIHTENDIIKLRKYLAKKT